MSEEQLRQDIKTKNIRSLYLFYGPEEYLKKNYTGYIESLLLSDELKLMNKVVLEGKATPAAIIDNCETLPVFSEKRIVIVKNSGLFKVKKKEQTDKKGKQSRQNKQEDELANLFANMPKHVCLIFLEQEVDRRVKYVELIKDNGLVVEFDFRRPEELAKWVIKMMRTNGHITDISTAAQMVEYCEPDMSNLYNEIEKLCAYAGDRTEITMNDVIKVCTRSVKSRIFDLTDAIAMRQCAKALSLLDDMITLKEPVQKIMFMIARQFRQLLQVKLLIEAGASQSEITSKLKLNPYVAGKIIKQAQRFTTEKLEDAISVGLDLDIAIKTGKIEDRAAVELMIADLTA